MSARRFGSCVAARDFAHQHTVTDRCGSCRDAHTPCGTGSHTERMMCRVSAGRTHDVWACAGASREGGGLVVVREVPRHDIRQHERREAAEHGLADGRKAGVCWPWPCNRKFWPAPESSRPARVRTRTTASQASWDSEHLCLRAASERGNIGWRIEGNIQFYICTLKNAASKGEVSVKTWRLNYLYTPTPGLGPHTQPH